MSATRLARDLLVHDYHAARNADELAREARDLGYATERAMQKADGERQPVTFRQWLEQVQPRRPGPDDVAALERAEVARLQDVHAAAEEAREAYEALAAERAGIMAELVAAGRSYSDVAGMVGVSRARVHQLVAAHARREGS